MWPVSLKMVLNFEAKNEKKMMFWFKQNNMVLGMTLGGNLVEDDFEFTDDESMTSEEGS